MIVSGRGSDSDIDAVLEWATRPWLARYDYAAALVEDGGRKVECFLCGKDVSVYDGAESNTNKHAKDHLRDIGLSDYTAKKILYPPISVPQNTDICKDSTEEECEEIPVDVEEATGASWDELPGGINYRVSTSEAVPRTAYLPQPASVGPHQYRSWVWTEADGVSEGVPTSTVSESLENPTHFQYEHGTESAEDQ